jgi:hypothetical protein
MLTERDARGGAPLPRNLLRLVLLAAAALAFASSSLIVHQARSEDNDEPKNDAEQVKKERAARLEVMRQFAASLAVQTKSADGYVESDIMETPLLHYSNPAGETLDATIWAWGRRGRPAALASISQEKTDAGIEKWSCEMVSLADKPVLLTARPGWVWAPAASGIDWQPVADAPPPGETPVLRSRQMRDLSRRFTAMGIRNDGKDVTELRLMDRPLSRFNDPEHGLVDGAIYSFANGTNPEVLLIVECRKESDGNSAWYHGLARMGADRVAVRLGETVVWERPQIKRWIRSEPYFSAFGPVDTVFGADK